MPNDPIGARPGPRLLLHLTIHVVLIFLYFLPGGLIWNRLDPTLLGLPFGVFVTLLLLPALIGGNMAAYVAGHWAEDKLVTSEVHRGVTIQEAERVVGRAGSEGGAETDHDQERG